MFQLLINPCIDIHTYIHTYIYTHFSICGIVYEWCTCESGLLNIQHVIYPTCLMTWVMDFCDSCFAGCGWENVDDIWVFECWTWRSPILNECLGKVKMHRLHERPNSALGVASKDAGSLGCHNTPVPYVTHVYMCRGTYVWICIYIYMYVLCKWD